MQEAEVGGSATEVMIKGAFFIHDDNVENFQMEVFLDWREILRIKMILDYKPCWCTCYEFFQQKRRNFRYKLHPIRNIHFQIHKSISNFIN